jgi:hypothetical protein
MLSVLEAILEEFGRSRPPARRVVADEVAGTTTPASGQAASAESLSPNPVAALKVTR